MEPVVESCIGASNDQPVTQETFLAEFKKVAESAAQRLKEQPVIVAHSENTFDGSGIKRLLSNKFELDKVCTHHPWCCLLDLIIYSNISYYKK